ncbi:hypothetical protein B0J11DRAFT_507516 [Dendryphion nanum]|uniref:Uncharacterized protein n=1 Tax=Dendryphion nanum TaxID=256645 RepID=A0A9P9IJH3_9PLEO|nr:hypothetical protein B0J11DRAFT_507516 [Dendryphion nanum]
MHYRYKHHKSTLYYNGNNPHRYPLTPLPPPYPVTPPPFPEQGYVVYPPHPTETPPIPVPMVLPPRPRQPPLFHPPLETIHPRPASATTTSTTGTYAPTSIALQPFTPPPTPGPAAQHQLFHPTRVLIPYSAPFSIAANEVLILGTDVIRARITIHFQDYTNSASSDITARFPSARTEKMRVVVAGKVRVRELVGKVLVGRAEGRDVKVWWRGLEGFWESVRGDGRVAKLGMEGAIGIQREREVRIRVEVGVFRGIGVNGDVWNEGFWNGKGTGRYGNAVERNYNEVK